MKRIVTTALFLAATFLTTHSAMAQSHAVVVNVPFNFTVNNTTLPAGKYTIASEISDPAKLIIRDSKNTIKAMDMGLSDPTASEESSKLVFHHYDDLYFLSEIHFATAARTIFFAPTKLERLAKKRSHSESVTAISIS